MLAATPSRARRAVRLNAARPALGLHTQQCGFPLSVTLLRQAGGATSPHNRSHPWRFGARDKSRLNIEHRTIDVLLPQILKQGVISMERPKGATEKSQNGCFIRGGIPRSYCLIREEIPRRFALLTPAKLRRNDIVQLP